MSRMRRNLEEYNNQIKRKQKSEDFIWRREVIWDKCLKMEKELQDIIEREDVIGVGYGPKSLNLKEIDIPTIKIQTKGEITKENRIKPISEFDLKKLDLPKEIAGIKTEVHPSFIFRTSVSQCEGMDTTRHQTLKPGRNIGILDQDNCATLGMKVWDKNNSRNIPESELTEYFLTCHHGFESIGLKVYQPGYPQNYYWQNEIGEIFDTYDSIASGNLCEVSLILSNKSRPLENLPISRSKPYDAAIGTEVNIQSASYLNYMGNSQSLWAKGRIAYILLHSYVVYEGGGYELRMQYAIEPEEPDEEVCQGGASGAVCYNNFGTAIGMHSAILLGTTINTSITSSLNVPELDHDVFDFLNISPTPYGAGGGGW